MKITKIKIKNLYGISEMELDGRSLEFSGTNGVGKTSIIDSIRLGLNNNKTRNSDYTIKSGEDEGTIIIETDTSLNLERRIRKGKTDYKTLKEDNKAVSNIEGYLRELFTPLQLDPEAFIAMTPQEQNRILLNLVQFDWDLDYIQEKFGEIPAGINYEQHILEVLNDIQDNKSIYYVSRQDLNREVKVMEGNNAELVKEIPEGYDYDKWSTYPLNEKFTDLVTKQKENAIIERAKAFKDSFNQKLDNLKTTLDLEIQREKELILEEKQMINNRIEKLKAEIELNQEKLLTVENGLAEKIKVHEANFEVEKTKLEASNTEASKYSNQEMHDLKELEEETNQAKDMIEICKVYNRFKEQQTKIDEMNAQAAEFTRKIEIARNLPSEILPQANIPIKQLTVENGIALIDMGAKGKLPVENLSDGEKLDLCVDITIQNPQSMKIILIDGVEKLSETNRTKLYAKCQAAGLQFIATRTTDDDEVNVVYFN